MHFTLCIPPYRPSSLSLTQKQIKKTIISMLNTVMACQFVYHALTHTHTYILVAVNDNSMNRLLSNLQRMSPWYNRLGWDLRQLCPLVAPTPVSLLAVVRPRVVVRRKRRCQRTCSRLNERMRQV